jgi:hypothetical protein
MKKQYTIVAEHRVDDDITEAFEFLNSRRKGYGKKFLTEYRSALKTLKTNPTFQIRYNTITCFPLKTFKYMIHFNIDEQTKTVRIYAVISTYQNPSEYWIKGK